MARMTAVMQRLHTDRRGATAVEYGLIVALIVIAVIAAMTGVGAATKGMWNNVNTRIAEVTR